MSEYTPEKWVVLNIKFTKDDGSKVTRQVIYSGNYGGWAGSDTWKISTNIKGVQDKGNYFSVLCSSGSTYELYKSSNGMSGYMVQMWDFLFQNFKNEGDVTIAKEYEDTSTI